MAVDNSRPPLSFPDVHERAPTLFQPMSPNHPTLTQVPARWIERTAVCAMSAFLLLPLLLQPVFGVASHKLDLLFAFNLVTSLLWVVLFALLGTRPLLTYLLLAPLVVTTAVDLFLMHAFRARLSSSYVTIALTDYADTGEFLSAYARPVAAALAVLLLVYVPALIALRRARRAPTPRAAGIAAALLAASYATPIGLGVWHGNTLAKATLDIMGKDLGAPVGAVMQAGLAVHLLQDAREMRGQRQASALHARKTFSADGEIYVWVIGESSRPSNWSLFGYARDTTPRLRDTPGVVGLSDVISTAPHTSIAVTSMMSLRPITDWAGVLGTRSIVSAFGEAGFRTYWLSAQEADTWGGYVPWVAAEAKRRRYFDRIHDGVLLEEFRQLVQTAARGDKLFVVLHTKGSHFDYSRRFPAEFERFKTPGAGYRDQTIDNYDNSIAYTDWFIAEVIATLDQLRGHSALLYASDHGENLLDDERKLLGHAIGNRHDLETAALFWLSEPLRQRRPDMTATLVQHAHAPLSLSDLPHSMLHLTGIEADGLEHSRSVFSPRFTPLPRSYIVRGSLQTYVQGTARPTPLVQQ